MRAQSTPMQLPAVLPKARIEAWGITDVGRRRTSNEDIFVCDAEIGLYVVCDGVGGYPGGEVAARMAADAACQWLHDNRQLLDEARTVAPSGRLLEMLARGALDHAAAVVHARRSRDVAYRNMATTMTLLLMSGPVGAVAHVGDSRVYLVSDREVRQLTHDHTLAQEMMRSGVFEEELVLASRLHSTLSRCLGPDEAVDAQVVTLRLHPGQRLVLCTDGLHQYLDPQGRVLRMVPQSRSVRTAARDLVAFANSCGGHDNITAIVIAVS